MVLKRAKSANKALENMIQRQLMARGITEARVLQAMAAVPRELFVPLHLRDRAYADTVLPIGAGQTLSQPFIVAYMLQALALEPTDRVLEIGTGSGYNTALLAALAGEVYSIETVAELHERAKHALDQLALGNVNLRLGDGYEGWPDAASFDAIVLTAAPVEVPAALFQQLKDGGRLLAPEGDYFQMLTLYRKRGEALEAAPLLPVRFVPMVAGGQPVG